MIITIADALRALRPNDSFIIRGEISYSNIELADKSKTLPTEDEINAKVTELTDAEPYRLLREERDRRLQATDWRASSDLTISGDWKAHRQDLRDLPAQQTPKLDSNGRLDPTSISWPPEPSS